MKVTGNATLHASPHQVWTALNDPAVLVRTIPGCEQLETVGPDRYRMTVTAGVASIKGTYLGDVALADHVPYSAFTLRASGSGAPGTVNADVKVALDEQPDGSTLLRYDADAVVGGTVGGVGQRVLSGVARRLAGEFFTAVDAHLLAPEDGRAAASAAAASAAEASAASAAEASAASAAEASAAGPPAAAPGAAPGAAAEKHAVAPPEGAVPQVFTRPQAPPRGRDVHVDVRQSLPSVLVGAAIALAGVLVGWRIGRRP